jgi:hypothetical protein
LGIAIFIIFTIIAIAALASPLPPQFPKKVLASVAFVIGLFGVVGGAVSYNDAGYCVHIRTIFGSESSKCDLGWYFSGWGTNTQWPQTITVANVDGEPVAFNNGTISDSVYRIKLADNWAGNVAQTSRFVLPQAEDKFLKMAHDFRTPENLTRSTLVPTVRAALDTTANLFTMEEYYSGGERDAFKKEFFDTIKSGPAVTERIENAAVIAKRVSPSIAPAVADTAETASETTAIIVEKKTDNLGQDIRPNPPGYTNYGITISTAIVQNLDPDDAYETQIVKRKEALSRRVIAIDQRHEQEEQRLLKIASAQTEIAEEQGRAQKEQIKQVTEAETEKKLALTRAGQIKEQAVIEKVTEQTNYEKNQIVQQSKLLTAQTDAKARELAVAADNALQAKLDAEIAIQHAWADAFSKRAVPSTVFTGGAGGGSSTGADSEVSTFMNLMTVQAAKTLAYDRTISGATPAKQ